jgi:hypothetical protein
MTSSARVYAHFGLALTGPARAAMKTPRRHSAPAGVGSAHCYALSDYPYIRSGCGAGPTLRFAAGSASV